MLKQVNLGAGICAGFTDRHGGVSQQPWDSFNLGYRVGDKLAAVRANRQLLSELLGCELAFAQQVHGAKVAIVTAPGDQGEVDGLVAKAASIAIAVQAADCLPVLLADAKAGVIGAAHCGRAGLIAEVVPAVVAAMRRLGAANFAVALGPSICGRCYEVEPMLAQKVARQLPKARVTTRWNSVGIDIAAGVKSQLIELGIVDIQCDDRCTFEDSALYSFRRQPVTGRQVGVIALQSQQKAATLTGVSDTRLS